MTAVTPLVGRIAGVSAIASGAAYLALFASLERLGEWLITAWNLSIIPAAIYLCLTVIRRGPLIAVTATLAGVAASVLWALWYRIPALEPWWIGLAAIWWLGIGWLLRHDRRRLGWFTVILGAAASLDFVLTAAGAPMPLFALGGFKIPLTMLWSFWLGMSLLRKPTFT